MIIRLSGTCKKKNNDQENSVTKLSVAPGRMALIHPRTQLILEALPIDCKGHASSKIAASMLWFNKAGTIWSQP